MHRPVLVEPATVLPVSVGDVKLALRLDGSELDTEIESQIKAAVEHYEGWTGVLGISLVAQTWRQDYDRFDRCLKLPLRPVQDILSVKWRSDSGQLSTIASSAYTLETDAGGNSFVRFKSSFGFPTGLYEIAAVSVDYDAGWPVVDGKATTPDSIKTAIKIRVQIYLDEAAKAGGETLERIERSLIDKYRASSI